MPRYTRSRAWLLAGIIAFIFALIILPWWISVMPQAPQGPHLVSPSQAPSHHYLEVGVYEVRLAAPVKSSKPVLLYYEHVSRIGTLREWIDLNVPEPQISIQASGQYRFTLADNSELSLKLISPLQQQDLRHRQIMFYAVLLLAALGTLSLLLSAWFSARDRTHHLTEAIKSGEVFKD